MCLFYILAAILHVFTIVKTEQSTAAPSNDALLGECPLSVFDLTFSSSTTDSVQLYFVAQNATDKYRIYPINKAISILSDPEFNKKFPTLIYIHGFYDRPGKGAVTTSVIVEAYRRKGGYNLILMDASSLIGYTYFRGARAARYIGIRLGNLLAQFTKSGFNIKTLDIVGHSVGAHLAGYAGKTYKKLMKESLPRITALDPSGPCFQGTTEENRLDKEDAEFVQVIHTGGIGLGMLTPIGDADFFINGGRKQMTHLAPQCYMMCSHVRSIYLWKYALMLQKKFVGIECKNLEEVGEDSCYEKGRKKAIMGPEASPNTKGLFYVKTTDRPPYYTKMNI